jgi:hypothetical protein
MKLMRSDPAEPLTRPTAVFNRYLVALLPALILGSYVMLTRLGLFGLPVIVALWFALLPAVLSPLLSSLWRECLGVTYLFLTTANADAIDAAVGNEGHRLAAAFLLLGLVYLAQRWRDSVRALMHPLSLLFIAFVVQEVLSAFAFGEDAGIEIVTNRSALLVAFAVVVVLVRRPRGDVVVPAVIAMAAILSVPIMLQELSNPDEFHLSSSVLLGVARGGGLYSQANNAAIAFTFALGYVFSIFLARQMSRSAMLVLVASVIAGILCAASRAGMVTALAVIGLFWFYAQAHSIRRAVIITVIVGTMVAFVPHIIDIIGSWLSALTNKMEDFGFHELSRLSDVFDALGGRTDTHANSDLEMVRLPSIIQSIECGIEHPLFGVGTGNFVDDLGLGSHFELGEIFAENGLSGLLLYLTLLVATIRSMLRLATTTRQRAAIILLPWLCCHLHHHGMMEYRFLITPFALLCAFIAKAEAKQPTPGSAG